MKGRTLQPAHTRILACLHYGYGCEPRLRERTALNSTHFHVHVYTPPVQLRWQIRRGAHFQRILISATDVRTYTRTPSNLVMAEI